MACDGRPGGRSDYDDRRACERDLVAEHARRVAEVDPSYTVDEALAGFCNQVNVTIHIDHSVPVVDNGKVTLEGTVASKDDKKRAKEMAKSIAGGLQDKGISYKLLNLQVNHHSEVMCDVLEAGAVTLRRGPRASRQGRDGAVGDHRLAEGIR